MNNSLPNTPTLHQETVLGFLNLHLHPKECILLKLYFSPKEKMFGLWNELWEGIHDYDLLPAGCRALMPSVVRKMQLLELDENWKQLKDIDLAFLLGLPRFVWTKNKFILNQTLRIAEFVGSSGIEIVAIKGTAELLSGADTGMLRSTSDIDLLIKPKDLDLFTQKMAEMGFEQIDNSHEDTVGKRSPFPKDQYVFRSKDKMMLEVDVHLMVNQYQPDDLLTALVWQDKIQSTHLNNLFVPSSRESYLIALVNGFRMHNWYAGSYLKYLGDSLTKLDSFCKEGFQDVLEDNIVEALNLQDWNNQIIQLGYYLSELDKDVFKCFKLKVDMDQVSISKSSALRSKLPNKNINILWMMNLSAEKKKYLLIILNLYAKAWKSRNKRGYFMKIIFFLVTDPVIRLFSLLGRRSSSIFFVKRNSNQNKKLLKTPISSLNWS